jgi:hypothetical protein
MSKAKELIIPNRSDDPWPYDGPIRRVDGRAPYNHYLWPMPEDDFWINQEKGHRFSSRWHLSCVALNNGAWLSEGQIWKKQYPTREAALRKSAADLIRTARASLRATVAARGGKAHWSTAWGYDALTPETFSELLAWIYSKLNRGAPRHRVPDLPAPRPHWADLPLFAAE